MHEKQHIALLPVMLKDAGVKQVVISPGSRNAPLIQVFYRHFGHDCISLVDERTAAYFALGIAMSSKQPVVLLSTSGTAALNYAPAIAEAFFQGIPLIAITADRPAEWIDQQDNQTIRQKHIYSNNLKAEFEYPTSVSDETGIWYCSRIISEAYIQCISGKPGPVHINVPLREPLYDIIPEIESRQTIKLSASAGFTAEDKLISSLNRFTKIAIVAGQHLPDKKLQDALQKITSFQHIVLFAEPVSNAGNNESSVNADLCLMKGNPDADFVPELVIYFGGQLVSKRIKTYLRSLENTEFWHISPNGNTVDTFQHLSRIIQNTPALFFESAASFLKLQESDFRQRWTDLYRAVSHQFNQLIKETGFGDITAIHTIVSKLKADDVLFAGNSSPVRFIQYNPVACTKVFSNRGTSGIDGCLSTVTGVAFNEKNDVYAILGDLSFVYDSNALWNKRLPQNLRIFVINNQGGGIFGLLDGPSSQKAYQEHFISWHPVDIQKLCEAFGVKHYLCKSNAEIENILLQLRNENVAVVIEIQTPGAENPVIFRNLLTKIKA